MNNGTVKWFNSEKALDSSKEKMAGRIRSFHFSNRRRRL